MRLPRLGEKAEDRLIEEAASVSLITGEKLINLASLKSANELDVRQAGLSLQKRGFGQFFEISGGGDREYHFGVRDQGFEYAADIREALRSRTLMGRLRRTNWNAVNAVSALIAAVAALFAAYFSYLSMTSH